jgi:hypothetical protein
MQEKGTNVITEVYKAKETIVKSTSGNTHQNISGSKNQKTSNYMV